MNLIPDLSGLPATTPPIFYRYFENPFTIIRMIDGESENRELDILI
jgi:hypothetical protein